MYVSIGLLIVFENDRLTIVFWFVKRSFLKRSFRFREKTIVFENDQLVLNARLENELQSFLKTISFRKTICYRFLYDCL